MTAMTMNAMVMGVSLAAARGSVVDHVSITGWTNLFTTRA